MCDPAARSLPSSTGRLHCGWFICTITPPLVGIITPAAGASLTGVVSITAEASDAASGVARVEFLVDGVLQATRFAPPFTVEVDTLDVPAGSHQLTARAVDGAGNSAEDTRSVAVAPQIQVQITAPADGSTVVYSPVLVQGGVAANVSEVGITVNGYVAEAQGGQFAVDGIALEPGANTLTATATDGAGVTVTASTTVTVVPDPATPPVTLSASFSSSLAPAAVSFDVDTALPNPVASYSMDFEGDGVVDSTGSTLSNLNHTYAIAGLYLPTLMVTDSLGNSFTSTTVVNILDRASIDAFLQSRWSAMRGALGAGEIETALSYFMGPNRPRYRTQFTALAPVLEEISTDLGAISSLLDLDAFHAEYELRRVELGGTFSYALIFARDEQGLWKIQGF